MTPGDNIGLVATALQWKDIAVSVVVSTAILIGLIFTDRRKK